MNVEFKETFSLEFRERRKNKKTEDKSLKTVVAYLNTEGGVLLIGVRDDGTIAGITADLDELHGGDLDEFLLYFRNILLARVAHELVIGLGSATVGDGRLGERERVVGITTVFSGDGNYCVSTVSKAVAYEDYEKELLESLKDTIQRVSKSMNWQPKSHVRLVFHSFKPFKNAEEDAVKKLVGGLGDFQVEYAFVDVVEQHPYILFDRKQKRTWAYDGSGKQKGILAPERGQFMRLSGHETLIVLTGPKELKQSSDGMPSPVLLRLGRGSTFRDLLYLTKQVNTFACHSWRGHSCALWCVVLY